MRTGIDAAGRRVLRYCCRFAPAGLRSAVRRITQREPRAVCGGLLWHLRGEVDSKPCR